MVPMDEVVLMLRAVSISPKRRSPSIRVTDLPGGCFQSHGQVDGNGRAAYTPFWAKDGNDLSPEASAGLPAGQEQRKLGQLGPALGNQIVGLAHTAKEFVLAERFEQKALGTVQHGLADHVYLTHHGHHNDRCTRGGCGKAVDQVPLLQNATADVDQDHVRGKLFDRCDSAAQVAHQAQRLHIRFEFDQLGHPVADGIRAGDDQDPYPVTGFR